MKKLLKRTCLPAIVFGLFLFAGLAAGFGTIDAKAASGYSHFGLYNWGSSAKTGKYYLINNSDRIYYSTNKSSGYQITPIPQDVYTNGKQAIYTRDNVLYKYVFSSGKETALKVLPAKGDQYFSVSAAQGKYIFLTRGSFNEWKNITYHYNTKSKKLKKIKANCDITAQKGKYVVGQKEYRTDVGPYVTTLYKITSSGKLSKVKKLASYGRNATFVGKKLYYASYDKNMRKVTLYRCKTNGSKKKKLAFLKSEDKFGIIVLSDIGPKKCTVTTYNGMFEYVYSTKTFTPIRQY